MAFVPSVLADPRLEGGDTWFWVGAAVLAVAAMLLVYSVLYRIARGADGGVPRR
jgi:hypothetical protein